MPFVINSSMAVLKFYVYFLSKLHLRALCSYHNPWCQACQFCTLKPVLLNNQEFSRKLCEAFSKRTLHSQIECNVLVAFESERGLNEADTFRMNVT